MFGFKKRRRERLQQQPLRPDWLTIIDRNVPYCRSLTTDDQRELHGLVQVFLAEKQFEGCGGLEMTDEIRVTVAAQACILLLRRQTDVYPTLRSILVYPHAYVAPTATRQPDGTVLEYSQGRLGESWVRGPVVLSWDDVIAGASDIHDGRNVVFHEFAHQLDHESGAADGAPVLPKRSMYIAWARVLGGEYEMLIDDITHHRRTLLDQYGATNAAEFFAVVTEYFFERPVPLKARHPELYEQLRLFYKQDPVLLAQGGQASSARSIPGH